VQFSKCFDSVCLSLLTQITPSFDCTNCPRAGRCAESKKSKHEGEVEPSKVPQTIREEEANNNGAEPSSSSSSLRAHGIPPKTSLRTRVERTPSTESILLPPELRHYIWQLTFEPQTLSIAIHNLYARKHTERQHSIPHSCIIVKPNRGVESEDKCLKSSYLGEDPEAWAPPPPGPIALLVCRESRAIALER
jgi:2EXR family